jgi:hypothetical protein
MRSKTHTITIQAPPAEVLKFLAEVENLPRWAIGFAKAVTCENGRFFVTTGAGKVAVRIEADRSSGVVDFFMSPAPGVEVLAASRVVPNGSGSEYVFTQFQTPGMPDEIFDKNLVAVEHELTVLRALLEVECPL